MTRGSAPADRMVGSQANGRQRLQRHRQPETPSRHQSRQSFDWIHLSGARQPRTSLTQTVQRSRSAECRVSPGQAECAVWTQQRRSRAHPKRQAMKPCLPPDIGRGVPSVVWRESSEALAQAQVREQEASAAAPGRHDCPGSASASCGLSIASTIRVDTPIAKSTSPALSSSRYPRVPTRSASPREANTVPWPANK